MLSTSNRGKQENKWVEGELKLKVETKERGIKTNKRNN